MIFKTNNLIFIALFLFLLGSCDYLEVKKTSSEEILNEELKTFNWNELDAYPTFEDCDSEGSKQEKRTCFEKKISDHLGAHLANQNFVVSEDLSDTLQLTFLVSDKGIVSITKIDVKSTTRSAIPLLDETLMKFTDSLPKVFPAIKRGQQVTSQFKLPIVLASN